MEETVKLEMTKAEAESLRTLIAECLEKMKAAQERMEQDQTEIRQLRAETRAILEREWKAASASQPTPSACCYDTTTRTI